MSRTTTLIVLFSLCFFGFAFTRIHAPDNGKRVVFEAESLGSKLHITNKLRSGLTLTVKPTNDNDYEANRDFGLTVEVQTSMLMHNVKMAWDLPRDMAVVSGAANFDIPEIKPGENQEFSIVVRSPSSDNSRVTVRALVNDNGHRANEMVHFNTVYQKDLDTQKAELAKRTRDAIEREPAARFKIYK